MSWKRDLVLAHAAFAGGILSAHVTIASGNTFLAEAQLRGATVVVVVVEVALLYVFLRWVAKRLNARKVRHAEA